MREKKRGVYICVRVCVFFLSLLLLLLALFVNLASVFGRRLLPQCLPSIQMKEAFPILSGSIRKPETWNPETLENPEEQQQHHIGRWRWRRSNINTGDASGRCGCSRRCGPPDPLPPTLSPYPLA